MNNKPNQEEEALTYKLKEPNVNALRNAYDNTLAGLESYFQQCRQNYDDRRNYWPGKSNDMRKNGADAFPWQGASDMEAHVIDERINSYVSLFMGAVNKANIRAYPVEVGDMARSRVVSGFLKWMVSSYIPNFKKQMELGANHMLERGIIITYCGWQKESCTYIQKLSLEQLAQADPELAQGVLDGSADEALTQMLKAVYPATSDKRAKRALKDLRKTGVAEISVSRQKINCPIIESLSPDGDFFFPSYVTDPQKAPYCFWRTYYTPQQLLTKVDGDGWDADWVDYVIEHYKGVNSDPIDDNQSGRRILGLTDTSYNDDTLIEVIHGYQRLIDSEDGSMGIYETVFHRDLNQKISDAPSYAKHELMNGYEDYPVVVTRLFEDTKRLYDVQAFPELLRGAQWQVKIERDSRVDRNSLATMPWIQHPVGNAPTDLRPGGFLPYRRQGEVSYGPIPPFNQGSMEMEQTMLSVADGLVGLAPNKIDAPDIRRYYAEKFLMHTQNVLKFCFKNFQRFGDDTTWFRVTGEPAPQKFERGDPDENFDIMIGYDILSNDPDSVEKKLQSLLSLSQIDRNGKMDIDGLITLGAYAIDPIAADSLIQPTEQAQQQVVKKVTDDLTKIFAGIEMPAQPNGAQIALQIIQQYAQQPDVMERIENDEAFKARLEKYAAQYTFQMQQMQNAQIGKVGTQPAAMGEVNTQQMQQ
jgi:hypothetical protein